MRKQFLTILFLLVYCLSVGGQTPMSNLLGHKAAAANNLVYRTTFTINHTYLGTADNTDEPFFVSITDNRFKSVINGGQVADVTVGKGYDIEFYSNSSDTTSLMHYVIRSYDPVAGILTFYIKIPTVTHSTDIVYYCRYGMPWINSDQGGGINGVFSNNYLAVWTFTEATGSNTIDVTGNGHDATNHNSPVQTAVATYGKSILFTAASSQYGDAGTFTAIDGTNKESFELVFKRTNSGAGDGVPFGKRNSTNYNGIDVWNDGNIYDGQIAPGYGYFANNNTSWHYTGFTYDGTQSSNSAKLPMYLDGAAASSPTYGGTIPATTPAAGNFLIGEDTQGGPLYASGTIAFAAVSSVVRNPSWMIAQGNTWIIPGTVTTAGAQTGPFLN